MSSYFLVDGWSDVIMLNMIFTELSFTRIWWYVCCACVCKSCSSKFTQFQSDDNFCYGFFLNNRDISSDRSCYSIPTQILKFLCITSGSYCQPYYLCIFKHFWSGYSVPITIYYQHTANSNFLVFSLNNKQC